MPAIACELRNLAGIVGMEELYVAVRQTWREGVAGNHDWHEELGLVFYKKGPVLGTRMGRGRSVFAGSTAL